MKNIKIRADLLKRALSNRHTDDFFITEVKNGPTHIANKGELLIMDALAIKKSWINPCWMGYEIKVSRSDFTRDDKWRGYMNYCNMFSFVCPSGLIQPEELPDDVGLIWFNIDKGTLYTKRKAIYRQIDIPPDIMMHIIFSKLESDRHPFFSSKRDFFEAYLEDKVSKRELGYRVSEKIRTQLHQLDGMDNMKDKIKKLKKVEKVLDEAGIATWGNYEDELKEALSGKANPKVKYIIDNIERQVERLSKLVN